METLYIHGGIQVNRFSCDCLSSGHSLTISIEKDETGRILSCELEVFLTGKAAILYRLKQAWRCLRGLDGSLGEFIFREEDYPELLKVVSQLVTSPWTSVCDSIPPQLSDRHLGF